MGDLQKTVWLGLGIGGGDAPPRERACAEAARSGVCESAMLWVDNLCRRAAERPPRLPEVLFGQAPVVLVARYPRAVRALLRFAGVPIKGRDIRWIAAEPTEADRQAEVAAQDTLPDDPGWPPWYPVIDGDRCTRCGQCVQFCLFGVYESAADRIPRVAHPANCKNECPACARICPATAIVFPRYRESPYNGADVLDDKDQRETQAQALQRLLGDDPLAALRARQTASRRLINVDRLRQALSERDRHRGPTGTGDSV